MGNRSSLRILSSGRNVDNESSSFTKKKKSKIVNKLIKKFFLKTSKSLKVETFIEQNRSLLKKLHPAFKEFIIIVDHWSLAIMSGILFLTIRTDMSLTCEELQFKLAQLETCENFMKIVDEIIPNIDSSSLKEESDDKTVKREIFRKFLGHLLWLAELFQEYKTARGNDFEAICYRAAKYNKTNVELWLTSSKLNKDIHLKRDRIKKAIEFVPDSVKLRIALAKIYIENGDTKVEEFIDRTLISFVNSGFEIKPNEWLIYLNEAKINEIIDVVMISMLNFVPDSEWLRIAVAKIEIKAGNGDNVQEIIDRTLISFANEGFKINPNEWLNAAERTNSNEIIDAVMTSIIGVKGIDENVKSSEIYLNHQKRIIILMLESSPKNKRLWKRAIFHKKINSNDLTFLLTIACQNARHDAAFSNLTQSKIYWMNEKFGVAQILFNKVKDNTNWKNLIVEEFEQFQNELEILRAKRQISIEETLSSLRKTSSRRDDHSKWESEVYKLLTVLKDEWLLGEHDVVQKILEEAISIKPRYSDICIMKTKIEIEKCRFDKFATFKSAIKSINIFNLTHEDVFFYLFIANLLNDYGNLQAAKRLLERARSTSPEYVEIWIALIRLELCSNEKSKVQALLTEAMKKKPKSGKLWAEAISMEERSKRGKKSAEALKICQDDKHETKFVILETANFFFSQGKIEKSRKWFNKTIELDPHFYDAWIHFYKLEKIYGNEESARGVLIRFIKIKSELDKFSNRRQIHNYGEKWCNSEYFIDNWHLTREELLLAIVNKIDVGSI